MERIETKTNACRHRHISSINRCEHCTALVLMFNNYYFAWNLILDVYVCLNGTHPVTTQKFYRIKPKRRLNIVNILNIVFTKGTLQCCLKPASCYRLLIDEYSAYSIFSRQVFTEFSNPNNSRV